MREDINAVVETGERERFDLKNLDQSDWWEELRFLETGLNWKEAVISSPQIMCYLA